jgi:hypothetical protein
VDRKVPSTQFDRAFFGDEMSDARHSQSVAVKLAFPDGSMTTSGLRREFERRRLVIERNAIAEMRKLCRVAMPRFGGREF